MTKVPIWILSMTLILTACTPESRKNQTDNGQDQLRYDTTKTAIIPWDGYPFDSINYRTAILTQKDINQVDSLFISSVTEYNNSFTDGQDDFKIDIDNTDYKKQLIAVTNLKGEKEVWVNCFCDNGRKYWKTEVVIVDDGGPCYFNFKVNLTTKRIYDFGVNGFA